MKPTITDEIIACILQLNADIAEITDIMDSIQPVHERLETLMELLREGSKTA